jgi:hypothetical protein
MFIGCPKVTAGKRTERNSKMRCTTFYPSDQKSAWDVPKGVDTHNMMNVIKYHPLP